jgi:hypothetical protein
MFCNKISIVHCHSYPSDSASISVYLSILLFLSLYTHLPLCLTAETRPGKNLVRKKEGGTRRGSSKKENKKWRLRENTYTFPPFLSHQAF